MKRARPTNVSGRGPLISEQGLGVAIVCIVKDESDYLEEWFAYHFALGVGHVFLYDNGSTDGSAALLERYQNHGLVTVVDWPLGGGQLAAYNHALRFFGRTADWLAFYDVDEFLVPLLDDDIPSLLARFGDAADVRVPRKEFGFSGHRSQPEGLAIDAFTETANVLALDPDQPPRVKSIVQPGSISALDVHLAFPADTLPPGAPDLTAEVEVRGIAQLNHYYTRSFEEFEAKRARSSATGRITRRAVSFDIPTIETDTSAQRFSERTAAMTERLRSLESKPYYYGSQLGIDHFPRPDDLGRFAEFAIANEVAGLDEPARFAAIRIKNLYDGVGLVGDLADSGYVPASGGIAGSVHTRVLIDHMRGHLEPELAAHPQRFKATHGRIALADGGHRLLLENGVGELEIEVPEASGLRCYSLGWLFGCGDSDGPEIRLGIDAERSDGSHGPKAVLPALPSRLLVGIVEVESAPQHIRSIRLEIQTDATELRLHDLFLVSYG